MRGRLLSYILVMVVISATAPWAAAREDGAPSGFSGGPAGFGESCISCHTFNLGTGTVTLLNGPKRYRAGAVYDLQVRVSDAQQLGAGFEVSAETLAGHQGAFEIFDATRTQLTGSYVTHTGQGYADSLAFWAANGNAFTFSFDWRAPVNDAGRVTFFVAGNAVNDAQALEGDHYYFNHGVSTYAVPGDSDADEDVDLLDVAAYQNCFNAGTGGLSDSCLFSDFDGDNLLALSDAIFFSADLNGPLALDPGAFVIADEVRGGLLYDHWMNELGIGAPVGTHPLYPPGGPQSGSVTFRCKECHGWDYKGVDGAYGNSGSHYTGIAGIFGTNKSAQEIFVLLTASPAEMPGVGHDMDAYGMSAEAIWDVTRMALAATVDTSAYINSNGTFIGVPFFGQLTYENFCYLCHGADGTAINFGTAMNPEYIGTLANGNPWELLHKIRFGHPHSAMVRMIQQGVTPQNLAHLGAYCASLPQ